MLSAAVKSKAKISPRPKASSQIVTTPEALLHQLQLEAHWLPQLKAGHASFPIRVPAAYLSRIRKGDPDDPLLRQVLPLQREIETPSGYGTDPVGDLASAVAPGVLHKYHGRALLIATGACAINCRYCFRRHFPYPQATAASDGWRSALAYIAAHPSIKEVILSGGDPLMLSTAKLATLTQGLATIAHVRTLRVHTRVPVVLPTRIDTELVTWWQNLPWRKVLVLHINHRRELDHHVGQTLRRLQDSHTTWLNQSVLLRGVNDTVKSQCDLSEALFAAGILPYYLHCLDRVQGAAHFAVEQTLASTLVEKMRARLPGYLVPRLVREVAGLPYKLPIL